MNAGASGGAAQRYEEAYEEGPTIARDEGDAFAYEAEADQPAEGVGRGRKVLAAVLIFLALAWVAVCGLVAAWHAGPVDLPLAMSWIATASVPLALLTLLWLSFGRTGRAETERFSRAVTGLRSEADALNHVLALVADRLANNRSELGAEAGRLMALGEEASDRLGRVTHYLAREAEGLDSHARAVEAAASQARVDFGVLLSDLPKAEQSARGFSDTLREAGMIAHERALALEAQLSAITARAQDVDAAAGGAAERLSAHVARIETSAGAATERLGEASGQLDATVNAALSRTGEAVAATRTAIDAQAEGLLALVEQCRARLVETGADAGAHAERTLAEAQRLVETIATGIAAQEQASGELVARLSGQIAGLDERLTALGQRAESQSTQMATALADLRDATATLRQEVDASTHEAAALVQRTGDMSGALDQIGLRLREDLPPALADVAAQADAMHDTVAAATAPVEAIRAAAADAAARLTEAEQSAAKQQQRLDHATAGLDKGLADIVERMNGLTALAVEADHAIGAVVRNAGPELVETLVRVRDTSRAAAAHAREAVLAAIPDAADALAEAARVAVGDSVTASVQSQIQLLEESALRAADAGRATSERLTRQLLALGQNAAALETRLRDEEQQRAERERDAMPQRVTLLIESLNSTAIDVTKILSNDITDTAWQAYLKGDRGVFTRKAVRLLTSGEAREIQRHYDQEPEFRAQVNRYIADFENLLRRVLGDGDGNALAVTLLSSDMGKLYVALAQAIQHLRV